MDDTTECEYRTLFSLRRTALFWGLLAVFLAAPLILVPIVFGGGGWLLWGDAGGLVLLYFLGAAGIVFLWGLCWETLMSPGEKWRVADTELYMRKWGRPTRRIRFDDIVSCSSRFLFAGGRHVAVTTVRGVTHIVGPFTAANARALVAVIRTRMEESDCGARLREGAPSDCEVSTLRFVLVSAIVAATVLVVAALSLLDGAWGLVVWSLWLAAVCAVAIVRSVGRRYRVSGGDLTVFDRNGVHSSFPVGSVDQVVVRSWELHLGITSGAGRIIGLPGLLRRERAALCRAIHAQRRRER